jgi:hypothetical protein
MTGSIPSDPIPHISLTAMQQNVIRLLLIPLLVYCAWLIEIFLLEGNRSLFLSPGALPLAFYTVTGCILTGMIIPVLIIRRSFLSGAVNMFQIGFRPLRRTVSVCTLTGVACYLITILMTPAGTLPTDLTGLFLLYLPTGIAAVMICWVLVGTHLQALVRVGGAVLSIPTGVVVTAILFGLTTQVHTPVSNLTDPLDAGILLGMLTALFFFAVRDVYATGIVVTTGMTLLFSGKTVPAVPDSLMPGVFFSALLAVTALLAIHGYFSRNYATVIVVPDR